ncbi:hypothetical protein HBI56_115510 [Parastagonospora nodorum]|uniref:Uncharacterized protein n=1 Tax=Phaeosphaeria nodorum (strain SN15 / ATCC MYA-4574 / FGSC 10173) TaxID=321614 RepID=A0A7U2I5H6_PHANO|nr:hypothetical protein HBH56_196370 [Parastagonospora nodorum]QRD00607.1 hypothetical protein JI435_415410 [Parastagonospora nodorum SN15]KAH3924872.1 hypothetical protein HBH54_187120 [Parastagonospora nodorum]KAH3953254.1 hypothetical protein HBH53_039260 [Parastagonospora nodorum]KAH3976607.1 hypothetical protein HBH52_119220 [Parastagonospora nodorum]
MLEFGFGDLLPQDMLFMSSWALEISRQFERPVLTAIHVKVGRYAAHFLAALMERTQQAEWGTGKLQCFGRHLRA